MAFDMIRSDEIEAGGVQTAPDRLTGTAQENKRVFDNAIYNVVAPHFNNLIASLTSADCAKDLLARDKDGNAIQIQTLFDELADGLSDRYTKKKVDELLNTLAKIVSEEMGPLLESVSYENYELILTAKDGTVTSFNIRGAKGDTGPQGEKGDKGDKGDTGATGPQGATGATGPKGDAGADGYSPVKGTDYWTGADKAEVEAEAADILSGSLLNDSGVIRQEVLPEGYPYKELGPILVEETEIEKTEGGFPTTAEYIDSPVAGEFYEVIVVSNGETYTYSCEANQVGGSGSNYDTVLFAGDKWGDTTFPSFFGNLSFNKPEVSRTVVIAANTPGNYTVSVRKPETITKIDKMYLPDDILNKPYYEVGHGLKLLEDEKTLCVNAVSDFKGDNTLPITAAAVQTTVGNIETLLATI